MLVLQEKELRAFHEQQRNEMKLLKHEVDMLPKDKRKEAFKRRKDEKEIEQAERVSGGRKVYKVN
jgi:STE20-like kinase